jgi:hypothetical protein
MRFQVEEERMLSKDAQRCPNCNEVFPRGGIEALKALLMSNSQEHNFKIFISEDREIKGLITGTLSL